MCIPFLFFIILCGVRISKTLLSEYNFVILYLKYIFRSLDDYIYNYCSTYFIFYKIRNSVHYVS